MAIDAQCPHCRKLLRAPDKKAGQQVNCPHCQQPIIVPERAAAPVLQESELRGAVQIEPQSVESRVAISVQKASAPASASLQRFSTVSQTVSARPSLSTSNGAPASAAPNNAASPAKALPRAMPLLPPADRSWYMRTPDDQQYGPIQRHELDQWVGEGRVDSDCQILCEGWEQWKWANDVYPQLVGASTPPPEVSTIVAEPKASPFPQFDGTGVPLDAEAGRSSPPPLPDSAGTVYASSQTSFLSAPGAEPRPDGRAWIVTDAGLAIANVALWMAFSGIVILFVFYALSQTLRDSSTLSIVSAMLLWTTYALLAAGVVLVTSWCVCLNTPRQSAARGWIQSAVAASCVGLAVAILVSILGLALSLELARDMVRHLPTMLLAAGLGGRCVFRTVLAETGKLFWRRAVKSAGDVLRRVPGGGPGVGNRHHLRDWNKR